MGRLMMMAALAMCAMYWYVSDSVPWFLDDGRQQSRHYRMMDGQDRFVDSEYAWRGKRIPRERTQITPELEMSKDRQAAMGFMLVFALALVLYLLYRMILGSDSRGRAVLREEPPET